MSLNQTTFVAGDPLSAAFMNAMKRGNQEQIALQPFPVPLCGLRYADGNTVNATGAAGNPKLVMGGWGSGKGILQGEDAHGTTKTETVCFEFAIPESYDDAQDVKLTVSARVNDSGAGTMSVKTIDVEAYEVAEAGTAGSDLCATAAQDLTTSMAQYTFVITATGLVRGDMLRILVRTVITESGGTGAQKAEIGGVSLLADIKG
jgi:hypothetical protein